MSWPKPYSGWFINILISLMWLTLLPLGKYRGNIIAPAMWAQLTVQRSSPQFKRDCAMSYRYMNSLRAIASGRSGSRETQDQATFHLEATFWRDQRLFLALTHFAPPMVRPAPRPWPMTDAHDANWPERQ